jgi:multimeric flavodoxin WrbA
MNASHIKVVAINGSDRQGGNTATLLRYVLEELEMEGIKTELIQLGGTTIHDCLSCGKCSTSRDRRCAQTDDTGNELIAKMADADGILFGSPTHADEIAPQLKALLDRACMVGKANERMFRHKVGAAVVAVRRAGALDAFDSLNRFFLINEMVVPGSSYWNAGFGSEAGHAVFDAEGIETMKTLGRNMAWLLENIKGPFALPDLAEIVSQ